MMGIENGKFARHIMNMIGDCLSTRTFMMWIVKGDNDVFSANRILYEKCKCPPIGNKENKIQPIGDKDKKLFRMWVVMCIAIYYPYS